jgi:hypothetical protein
VTTEKDKDKDAAQSLWAFVKTHRKKVAKVAFKIASLPLIYVAAEAAQLMLMVGMAGLLFPLPAGTLKTGVGFYGAWCLFRYIGREIVGWLRGRKIESPMSGVHTAIDGATTDFLRTQAAKQRRSSGPTPEQAAMLAAMLSGASANRARPAKVDEDDGGNVGQYL